MNKIRKINQVEILDILRKEGAIIDNVILNSSKFISICSIYRIHPNTFKEMFLW